MSWSEPAFPCPTDDAAQWSGMTLRDYFAAAALTGLLAVNNTARGGEYVRDAYKLADAMLAERAK